MRLRVNCTVPLAVLLLGASANPAYARPTVTALPSTVGPAADYPVTVGPEYTIGTTTWIPADQLNYDAVGYSGVDSALGGVSAAHKTLPFPSYAEVTSLETGRTILVRIMARGPQDNATLVALSPDAANQLGLPQGRQSPVRVRRVNPPEVERASLRSGGEAPMRMATPDSLLQVLRRKLAEQSPALPPPSAPPKMPTNLSDVLTVPQASIDRAPAPRPIAQAQAQTQKAPSPSHVVASPASRPPSGTTQTKSTAPAAVTSSPAVSRGTHVVQVAAFSTRERANTAARSLNGRVTQAGSLWRVRLGPFLSGKEAASALEKAKRAGYSDARILRVD